MKKIILICVLVLVLLIVGCGQKVVCNKSYILVGSECCLDQDDNSICDKDEVKEDLSVNVNKGETQQIDTIAITGLNQVKEISNENPIAILISGMDNEIKIIKGTEVKTIVISGNRNIILLPEGSSPELIDGGLNNQLKYY